MNIIYETELYHHGVKGMKWGVRRDQKRLVRAARSERKASLANAKTDKQRSAAKEKYKRTISNIKTDTKAKLKEIDSSPQAIKERRIKRGVKATVGGLAAIGSIVVTAKFINAVADIGGATIGMGKASVGIIDAMRQNL